MRRYVVVAVALVGMRAHAAELVGGTPDPREAVAWVSSSVGSCTGTYIARGRVLTAAHCVPEGEVAPGAVLVGFVEADQDGAPAVLGSTAVVRFADSPALDLAIIEIDADRAPVRTPIAVLPRELALGGEDLGGAVVLVGFGARQPPGASGVALERERDAGASTLAALEAERATVRSAPGQARACFGDSGGPLLVARGGVEYVAGVLSTGAADCSGLDHYVRVDAGRGAQFVDDHAAEGGCAATGQPGAGMLLVLAVAVWLLSAPRSGPWRCRGPTGSCSAAGSSE